MQIKQLTRIYIFYSIIRSRFAQKRYISRENGFESQAIVKAYLCVIERVFNRFYDFADVKLHRPFEDSGANSHDQKEIHVVGY